MNKQRDIHEPNLGMVQSRYMGCMEVEVAETMHRATPARIYLDDVKAFAPGYSKINPYALLATTLDIINANSDIIKLASVGLTKDIVVMPINADRVLMGNVGGKLGAHLCTAPMDIGLPVGIMGACIAAELIGTALGVGVNPLGIDTTMVSVTYRDFETKMNAASDREVYPLVRDPGQWLAELRVVTSNTGTVVGLKEPWFRRVLSPLRDAHGHVSAGRYDMARKIVSSCADEGWRISMEGFINAQEVAA